MDWVINIPEKCLLLISDEWHVTPTVIITRIIQIIII